MSNYFFREDIFGHFVLPEGRLEFYEFLRRLWYKIAGLIHFLGTKQLARTRGTGGGTWYVHHTHSLPHVVLLRILQTEGCEHRLQFALRDLARSPLERRVGC